MGGARPSGQTDTTGMRIDTSQHMRLEQRMKLAPRMIQSMEILQMGALALEERIEQELSSNPTLELQEPGSDLNDMRAEQEQVERDASEGERELVVSDDNGSNSADDFERLTNLSEEYGETWESNNFETGESFRRAQASSGERDAKIDAMANTAARPQSLADQLISQWILVEAEDEIREAGEFLIGFIDEDGYLRSDLEELLPQAPDGMTLEHLEQALVLFQRMIEPVGIGARDVRECLLLQINAREMEELVDLSLERALVEKHLKDIEANRLPKIAKSESVTVEEVKAGIDNLRQFHFHPGRLLADDIAQCITPDAMVEYDERTDRYVAALCNGRVPPLRISPSYNRMSRNRELDRRTRDFVSNNIRSARWLIEAIQQRESTLLRVINVVIEAQRDFFEQGPQALKPLPMTLVADQLGIHVATVSRAVSEKYIQTPRGIFPLRMFFSGGTETESGDQMSWAAVQAKLEQIIEEEDKAKPYNDDQLVVQLKEKGIEIARRTVAKYRKQLNIPPARQRKEY